MQGRANALCCAPVRISVDAMKIQQLPVGTRFHYDGRQFVKTGPMFAAGEDGRQHLIPKYARLEVVGSVPASAPGQAAGQLARAEVAAAFESFCSDCRELLAAGSEPAFAAARERFLQALEAQR